MSQPDWDRVRAELLSGKHQRHQNVSADTDSESVARIETKASANVLQQIQDALRDENETRAAG
jgi:hypothetical protein